MASLTAYTLLKLGGASSSKNCEVTRNRRTQISVVRVVRRICQNGKSIKQILGFCIRVFFLPTLHAVAPATRTFEGLCSPHWPRCRCKTMVNTVSWILPDILSLEIPLLSSESSSLSLKVYWRLLI